MLDKKTRRFLAWNTHKEIYFVNRLTYGTNPASSVFQKIVEKILIDLKNTTNFLDNGIVTDLIEVKHTNNLKTVYF